MTNLPTELLWGDDAIEEQLGGLRFRVRPNAFLQTNTEMAEQLYTLAREFAGLAGGETVYDLYCGIGTIGLSLAADALTVWGIEISEESVACAIENSELNSIGNAAFFAGNVGRCCASCATARASPTSWSSTRRVPGLAGKALRGSARSARPASCTCRATRRRSPATSSDSARTTATRSSAPDRSTCSRTRRTSSAYRCWSADDNDDVGLQGVRHAVPAGRRAAVRLPDLRGRATVRSDARARRGSRGKSSCDAHTAELRDDHGLLGIGMQAGVRDRPARAARSQHRRQRALGLHPVPRRRARRAHRRRGRDRRDRRSRTLTSTRRWSSGRTRSAARSTSTRPTATGSMRPDAAVRVWSGESHELGGGLTLVRCGGHFDGAQVLHWAERGRFWSATW